MIYFSFSMTEDEAAQKYRSLSLLMHPDKNPDKNAGDNFREMNEEYKDYQTVKRRLPDIIEYLMPEFEKIFKLMAPPPEKKIEFQPEQITSAIKSVDGLINTFTKGIKEFRTTIKTAKRIIKQ